MQPPEPIGGCRNSVESTRQVANLLAAAAPEVLPPRDTLRAVAPDRYTLKVSIDQECEQGLRLLKDLMAHLDPRMSWGDLVARVVREAVARHDPRGGGRGERRKGADSAGASLPRTPKETRVAGAAGASAQRAGESSGQKPNRTGAAGAAAGPARRADETTGREPNRTGAAGAAAGPARRADETTGREPNRTGAAGAAARPARRGRRTGHLPTWPRWRRWPRLGAEAALLQRRSRHPRYCWMALVQAALHWARPPRLRGRRATLPLPTGSPRSGCWPALVRRVSQGPPRPWMAPVQVACHWARPPLLRRRSRRPAPCWMAPMRALVCRARRSPLRRRSGQSVCPLTADRAARRPKHRAWRRRMASLRAPPCRARRRRRSRCSACSRAADRPTQQPEQRRTRPANLFTAGPNPRGGATFPRLSGATSGYATADAAVIATRSPGGVAALPICCRSTTCCLSPRAVARSRPTWLSAALLTTECATATDRLSRRRCRGSASSALPARHSTALADCLQVAGGDTLSQPREPSGHPCIFATVNVASDKSAPVRTA